MIRFRYKKSASIFTVLIFIGLFTGVSTVQAQQSSGADIVKHRQFFDQYCVMCHNETLKTAGLMIDKLDINTMGENGHLWDRIVTRLTLRAMPPVGHPIRPSESEYEETLAFLQSEIEHIATQNPNPGRPIARRLNRTEYANAIRDLIAIEIDAESLLPADNTGGGFDNIADVLSISPLLMERYMFVAGKISHLALGAYGMKPAGERYTISENFRQESQMSDDLPFGSRGGMAVQHYFPLDGEYTLKVDLKRNLEGYIFGLKEKHTLNVHINHELVASMEVGGEIHGRPGPIFTGNQVVYYRGDLDQVGYEFSADEKLLFNFPVKAGQHLIGVSFVDNMVKPTDVYMPKLSLVENIQYKGGDPAVAGIVVTGPYNEKGIGQTASREKIFVCRPVSPDDRHCAEKILSTLARQAYRRPVRNDEIADLLHLFEAGQQDSGFDVGIELALQRILAGPEFLFRVELDPPGLAPGDIYPVSDIELASRLSFFLWNTIPDEELLTLAERGKLHEPAELEQQIQRMITDPRFAAFAYNFGRQWLGVRELDNSQPILELFPEYDAELREAFRQELLLWFESMVMQDKSVLDVLTSDYTYINERLAEHYGIPGIYGSHFRPIHLTEMKYRNGLFGKGGILMATSFNNRTSPVIRGKWILEALLHMEPPAPPDDVPALQVEDDSGKALTLKQAMEKHRANPVCASCHKLMDPIGLALENFDAIGSYRQVYTEADNTAVDASSILFDSNSFDDFSGFKQNFMQYSNRVVHTITEKVLTYALGRSVEYYDQAAVRDIVRNAGKSNYAWSSLISEVVKSKPFQYRRAVGHDDI